MFLLALVSAASRWPVAGATGTAVGGGGGGGCNALTSEISPGSLQRPDTGEVSSSPEYAAIHRYGPRTSGVKDPELYWPLPDTGTGVLVNTGEPVQAVLLGG